MKKYIFLLPIFLMLAACSGEISESAVRRVATEAALGTPPPPMYQTAAALIATPTSPAMPTKVTVIDYASTMVSNEMQALLTRQAGQVQLEETKQASDLAVERARQAAEQAKLQVEQAKIAATERAGYMDMTRAADGRTAQAYNDGLTAQVADARTAVAMQATEQMRPTADMWTVTAIAQAVNIKQGEVDSVTMATQRQTWRNYFDAMLPWTITVCLAFVGARGFQTWVKTRTHPRDEHGRPQILQRELQDGGVVIVRPDQMETAIVKVTNEGDVIRYGPMDRDEQSRLNRGNGIADIVGQLPSQYAQAGKDLLGKFAGSDGTPSIRVLSEDRALSPVLDEAEGKLVEE